MIAKYVLSQPVSAGALLGRNEAGELFPDSLSPMWAAGEDLPAGIV